MLPFYWPPPIAATPSGAVAAKNQYWNAPTAPSEYDDEFTPDGTYNNSPDLADRGWSVFDDATGSVPQVRADNVNPWDTTTPADNTYRSTLTPSGLLIQPSGTSMVIYKAVAGAGVFVCEIYPTFSTNTIQYANVGIYKNVPTIVTPQQCALLVNWYNASRGSFALSPGGTYTSGGGSVSEGVDSPWGLTAIRWDGIAGGNQQSYIASPVAHRFQQNAVANRVPTPVGFSAGAISLNLHGGMAAGKWWVLRCMRYLPVNSFPGFP